MKKRIATVLRSWRVAAGLTQNELSARTGIHRPNISRAESGAHAPSLATIARIVAATGADPRELFRAIGGAS